MSCMKEDMIYNLMLRNFVVHEGKWGDAAVCFPGLGSLCRNQCPSYPDKERLDAEFLFHADDLLNEGDLRSSMYQRWSWLRLLFYYLGQHWR